MNALKTYRVGELTVAKIPELILAGFTPRTLLAHVGDDVLRNSPDWAVAEWSIA
jgi:hypothetical protein